MSEFTSSPEALEAAVEAGRERVRRGMHLNTTHGYRDQEYRAIAEEAFEAGRQAGLKEAEGLIGKRLTRDPGVKNLSGEALYPGLVAAQLMLRRHAEFACSASPVKGGGSE